MSQHQGLRSLRQDKGWSQEQLATLSGLSERTIQRVERGDAPSVDTLSALAACFDLSPAQLRDIMQAPQETHMAADDTPTTQDTQPLLTRTWKRLLIGGAVYLGVMSWLALMQAFAGWDPELLPFIALVGAGLLATYAFSQLAGQDD